MANRPPLGPKALVQYLEAIKTARAVANKFGYAIGVHGSQTYDLDLIACPWTDSAAHPIELAEAIAGELKWYLHPSVTEKPHGRLGFLIYAGRSAHIDLSVMPRLT